MTEQELKAMGADARIVGPQGEEWWLNSWATVSPGQVRYDFRSIGKHDVVHEVTRDAGSAVEAWAALATYLIGETQARLDSALAEAVLLKDSAQAVADECDRQMPEHDARVRDTALEEAARFVETQVGGFTRNERDLLHALARGLRALQPAPAS